MSTYRIPTRESHLHISEAVYQMWSDFPRNFCTSARLGGLLPHAIQVLVAKPKGVVASSSQNQRAKDPQYP